MSKKRVVITGLGVLSALGNSPEQLFDALCRGQSGLKHTESLTTDEGEPPLAAQILNFSGADYLRGKNVNALDRISQLATVAAQFALEDGGWTAEMRDAEEIGMVLGTMFAGLRTILEFDKRALTVGPEYVRPLEFANTVLNAPAGQAAIWHNLRGVNSTITQGGSSGLQAIGFASELIRSGRERAVVAGGIDELCRESFHGFRTAGQLAESNDGPAYPIPFDRRRNGFALGEAAAFLVLEDADLAAAQGRRALAEVLGFASHYDCSAGLNLGGSIQIAARTILSAIDDANLCPEQIDAVYASANGSVLEDRNEALAIARAFGPLSSALPATALKSMLGETLGASGAVEAVAMTQAFSKRILPGIPGLEMLEPNCPLHSLSSSSRPVDLRHGLINSSTTDGFCCSMVLSGVN